MNLRLKNIFDGFDFCHLGIYWIQNLITAVVYRAFRGYFLNSIINSQLRRRVAIKASFEVLRKRISNTGSSITKYKSPKVYVFFCFQTFYVRRNTVPISIVEIIVNSASINQWHINRITQRLNELKIQRNTIDYEQYSTIMQLLDLNPKLLAVRDQQDSRRDYFFEKYFRILRLKLWAMHQPIELKQSVDRRSSIVLERFLPCLV